MRRFAMMTMKDKKMVTREWAKRYQEATKGDKGMILNEFTALTGYTRSYASFVLRHWGKNVRLRIRGQEVVFVLGERVRKKRMTKPRVYDDEVLNLLKRLWYMSDCLCGKRLAPFLKETLPILEKFGEIKTADATKEKLMKISPATIDRLLSVQKKGVDVKPRARTKPGTLLKHQIPIRRFSDWEENRPGFVEIDLVSHDGGSSRGDFIQSLNVTDVCTGWTEMQAVKNKAQVWVCFAIDDIKERLPFLLSGIDSDNGSEFINAHLESYCRSNEITFTRTRPNRKNDNCFIEQKNYTAIRKTVGYARYDTEQEQKLLNEIYKHLRVYMNFFLPSMKLAEKTRIGSKIKKRYEIPSTPYKKLLESLHIDENTKEKLTNEYVTLNPAQLKRDMEELQRKLYKFSCKKEKIQIMREKNLVYNNTRAYHNISK